MSNMRYIRAFLLTTWLYGAAGWGYIVLNAEVHPWTLSMRLTHFLPYPREDTFGAICFAVSLVSFFLLQITKRRKFFDLE
jgi:hypothetical protein